MHGEISFEGEVTERQTLLDGTEEVAIDAAGAHDGEVWQLALTARWPKERTGAVEEATLTFTGPSGAGAYGELVTGSVETVFDEDTAVELLRLALSFRVESGDGALAGAVGTVEVAGPIEGDEARLTAEIALSA